MMMMIATTTTNDGAMMTSNETSTSTSTTTCRTDTNMPTTARTTAPTRSMQQQRQSHFHRHRHNNLLYRMFLVAVCSSILLFGGDNDTKYNKSTTTTTRIQCVDAFASNLVVTTIGCMTDLSTDEIIMNNEVKLPEESDFPKMHLVVLDEDDNHLESPFKYHPSTETELKLAFVNPYKDTDEGRELGDIQFVMEVGVVGAAGEEEDGEAPSPASFINGGAIGCDGNKRVSASLRDYDGHVKLRINDPASRIRIWAGWATGQESVRLVPDLILEPGAISTGAAAAVAAGADTENPPDSVGGDGTTDAKEEKEAEIAKPESTVDDDTAADGREEASRRKEPSKNADAKRKPKKNPLSANGVPPELTDMAEKTADAMQDRIVHKLGDNANGNDRNGRARGGSNYKPGRDQHIDLQKAATDRERMPKQRNDERNQEIDGNAETQRIESALKRANDAVNKRREQRKNDEELKQPLQQPSNNKNKHHGKKVKDIKTLEAEERQHRRDLAAQMKRNFSKADNASDLDMVSFGIGCAFFILSVGGIIVVFGKKRDKGRRDL
jgi:hypothetical protein